MSNKLDINSLLKNKWFWIVGIILLVGIFSEISSCSDKGQVKKKSTDSYIEAVQNENFTEAHQILNNLLADYISMSDNYNVDKYGNKFWNAANYIYKAEMQYLLPQNDPEADKRLLYTLDDFTPIGEAPEADHVYGLSEHNDHCKEFEAYINFATGYNKLCLEMIKIALRNDKVDFAEDVLNSMKTNYHKSEEHYNYTYTINDRAKEEGRKMISVYKNK